MKNLVHETVVRLGEQRGYPRYFANTRYLARAGFEQGQWLLIEKGNGTLSIRAVEAFTGKRVQEKNGCPLIDLNAKLLKDVFGETHTIHVVVAEKEITLSVHPIARAQAERLRDGSCGSIFSGAGMLDQAAAQAGFITKWAIENDRATANVFSENHPGAVVYEMSAHEACFSRLDPVELLHFGLCCQPWSRARTLNSDGSKVDRTRPATEHPLGDMALWAFLIIAKVNPRTIIIECAPAFEGGELWASLTGAIRRLGYHVQSQVVNSHDYGALTKRRRSVTVATTPEPGIPEVSPFAQPLAGGADRPTAATILDSEIPEDLWWDRATKEWVFRVNERNAAKGSGFGFQVVTPESTSMGTLTAEYGETKNDQPVVAHPTKPGTYRFFTIAEGKRIFGIPANYKLPEAKTVAWRLVGQAVHVPTFFEIIRRATRRSPEAQPASPVAEAWPDCPLFAGLSA